MNNQNTEFDFDEYRRLFDDAMSKEKINELLLKGNIFAKLLSSSTVDKHALIKNGTQEEMEDCYLGVKNYILKFFCPLTTGQHALIKNNEISIIAKETMKDVYLKRWDIKIKKWYEKDVNPKEVICDFNQPMIGNKFINLSKQLKHQYQEYKLFDNKAKKGVEMMLNYIKEVWANNDENMYKYLLCWLSKMVKGEKNKSCLYLKSIEGVGKSTLTDFLRDYVVGIDISLKGKADHLKGQHNLQMMGKLLVTFEELQIFNNQEWYAIDAELKDLITDDIASYTDKYEKRFQTINKNSYIINTNFDLKGAHGRRMCVLEVNVKYLNNFEYFDKLRKACFNDVVGHAFYCYLKEIDISNYQSHIIPETQAKREIYLHLLPPQEKFLKKYFALRHAGIKMKTSALYKMFEESEFYKQGANAHTFRAHLREIGFASKIRDGYEMYDITYDQLLEFGKKRKWFDKSDIETQKEVEEADEEDKIYVDKRKYIETEERIKKMESEIKMLYEFIEIQRSFNETQQLRNEQKKLFNEISKQYDSLINAEQKPKKEIIKPKKQLIEEDDEDDEPDVEINRSIFDKPTLEKEGDIYVNPKTNEKYEVVDDVSKCDYEYNIFSNVMNDFNM